MNPDFSIIITCYNIGKYIPEAIESVRKSTHQSFEIIVVDDCSTDEETLTILDEFEKDDQLTIIRHETNQRVGTARNTGISASKGKYILPLDGDDRILPHYLSTAYAAFQENDSIAVVYCNVRRFGDESSTRIALPYNFINLLSYNYISNCSVYKKEVWEACGGYDTKLENWEDWEFWINVGSKGYEFLYINDVLFEYRAHSGSKSNKVKVANQRIKVARQICTKHQELYTKHVTDIFPLLHGNLSRLESVHKEQIETLVGKNTGDLARELRQTQEYAQQKIEYYESSIFWKIKLFINRIIPIKK